MRGMTASKTFISCQAVNMLIRLRSVHLCSYFDALSREQVLHTYMYKLYIVNKYKKVDRIGTSA